ncbi:MAG: energy transducer TonB [Bacteroidetes bacterium]|nr:energy transducer TonB [Bacteroidota bacterium]
MHLSQSEENRNKAISLGIALLFFGVLILILIWFKLITPNPPFPVGGGGGEALNFGTYIEGTGDVEENGIGDATSVVTTAETSPQENVKNEENIVTSENGENVDIKNDKPKVENNNTVVIPVKPKEKTAAELLAEKFNKNKGKNGGGDGNSGHAGNEGDPSGDPNTHGTGGTGGGDGGGNGPGSGPGNGPGSGPGSQYGFDLKGRTVLTPPPMSKDTKEEGVVVVEITVDKNGNVIKADPNGRGTNTSSALLKAKARQAALATKFNVSGVYEEQKGTIRFTYAFDK